MKYILVFALTKECLVIRNEVRAEVFSKCSRHKRKHPNFYQTHFTSSKSLLAYITIFGNYETKAMKIIKILCSWSANPPMWNVPLKRSWRTVSDFHIRKMFLGCFCIIKPRIVAKEIKPFIRREGLYTWPRREHSRLVGKREEGIPKLEMWPGCFSIKKRSLPKEPRLGQNTANCKTFLFNALTFPLVYCPWLVILFMVPRCKIPAQKASN